MATCFCGCGEKVGLADRGINKQGQRTVELLARLDYMREQLGEIDSLGVLEALVAEGEDYAATWKEWRLRKP